MIVLAWMILPWPPATLHSHHYKNEEPKYELIIIKKFITHDGPGLDDPALGHLPPHTLTTTIMRRQVMNRLL